MLEREDLYLPAGALAYYGHWITAPGRSPALRCALLRHARTEGQQGKHDAAETVHDVWISPREALERGARGEIELVHATQQSLKELARFSDPRAAFEYARSSEIEDEPGVLGAGQGRREIFRRGDAPYFEIHWTDPEETGETTYDIIPGTPKRLDR